MGPESPRTVIVAEDHAVMRELLERMLSARFSVVASVADGVKLVDAVAEGAPDLLVVDAEMPRLSGLDALRILRRRGVSTPAVIVTSHQDSALARRALDVGASAFVLKLCLATDLELGVDAALAGLTFVSGQ
jgi:DNA-binding NarL/FixJ family response regulator